MTKKRFDYSNYDDGTESIYDREKDEYYWDMQLSQIEELLNELNDENEQLQQRNNRQAKQLDRLYSLIEKKDWRTLSDILDDFQRCEEQLQRESGTYGDLE